MCNKPKVNHLIKNFFIEKFWCKVKENIVNVEYLEKNDMN